MASHSYCRGGIVALCHSALLIIRLLSPFLLLSVAATQTIPDMIESVPSASFNVNFQSLINVCVAESLRNATSLDHANAVGSRR